jgi:phosphocarrier protein HPr
MDKVELIWGGAKKMVSKVVTVKNASGLHAKPASIIAKKASKFNSQINIEFNGKKGNIKTLIGILSLRVYEGDSVKVVASGPDEKVALDEV